MSYCRWSSDDFNCDLYCYGDVSGGYTTHVASNRVVGEIPKTPDIMTASSEEFADAMNRQLEFLKTAERKRIDLPHAGESFNDPDLASFRLRVLSLIELGYRVPADVIPSIEEELCPKCKGVPVAPEESQCRGCCDCDFRGTREGYDEMQKIIADAYAAHDEYIKAGVCARCGAKNAKEAEKLCRPSSDESGEYFCDGDGLWEDEHEANANEPS